MTWIISSIVYCLLDIVQGLMGILVGVYESIGIDIGYNPEDTSPDTFFSYTFLTDETAPKGAFDSIFPLAHLFMPVFTYMAYVIVLFAFVFNLYKLFFATEQNSMESPLKLIGRFFLSLFTVTWSYAIFVYLEKIAQRVYTEVNTVYLQVSGSVSDSFWDKMSDINVDDAFIQLDSVLDGIGALIVPLLCIGFFFTMIWNYCKLILEVVERYILLGVMFYTCPLAFSSIISNKSQGLFSKWSQMLLTQFLLMVFNLFFVGIFNASIINVYTKSAGETFIFSSLGDFVFKNFCLIAWLMIGQRIDQHLNSLGFSVAQAGSGMASALFTTAGAIATGLKLGKGAAKFGKDAVGAAKDTIKKSKEADSANGMLSMGGKPDNRSPISAAGTAENAAKVENIQGRDAATGRLTAAGVKEALDSGATLTGQDAKTAAEIMGLPQAKEAGNIDWNNSEINREGAFFAGSAEEGSFHSHVGFGSDWTAESENGTKLAQMPVPTEDGFADGSRVMTDTDLREANSGLLDQLSNPVNNTEAAKWTTPQGNPITNADGSYTEEALKSPYFIGTDINDPSQRYVAGLDSVNTFDLDKGGNVSRRETTAYGDMPSMQYSVQHLDGGKTATPAFSKSVLDTTSPTNAGTAADAILKKKGHPATQAYNEQQKPNAVKEFAENFSERRARRPQSKKTFRGFRL